MDIQQRNMKKKGLLLQKKNRRVTKRSTLGKDVESMHRVREH